MIGIYERHKRGEYKLSPIENRFWPKVHKTKGCWVWTGELEHGHGYGQISVRDKKRGAHRVSWEIHNGPIPKGMWVLHKCDNMKCVNPYHLFLGTNADNMRDKVNKGRQHHPIGDINPASKLTQEKVDDIRELYQTGYITQKRLSIIYGVVEDTIYKAVNYHTWKGCKI